MSTIKVLSPETAGRIAAGEVIARPASAMKELVENSIDAGATRIRVIAEQGGQRLLQVIDNGCGMNKIDVLLCLETHATSKIREESDVGQIHTLGFRGEALPSIAAVSRFHMQSRQADELEGNEVIVNYGKIQDVIPCGCAPGTNIKVSYLFGNLPARRKFLKSPASDDAHLQETLFLLALSRPDISFELLLNGRQVIQVSSSQDIAARALMLLGKDNFESMMPVDYYEDNVHVYGYISKPGFTRNSRREQRSIINGRAATADSVFFGIRNAYDTLIPKGRYPSTMLYIDLQADRVDVNIHPTKHEVRFREATKISNIIAAAIRNGLKAMPGGAEIFDDNEFDPTKVNKNKEEIKLISPVAPAPYKSTAIQTTLPFPGPAITSKAAIPTIVPQASETDNVELPGENLQNSFSKKAVPAMKLHCRLGKKHLLAESESGLVVISLSAAQQRIVYERLLKNLNTKKVAIQPLLLPLTINLSPDESKVLQASLKQFKALGFSIEEFSGNSFIIEATPASLPDQDYAKTVRDMIDDLRNNTLSSRQNVMNVLQIASRHAAKIKDNYSHNDLQVLLQELMKCEVPYICPAGKPTMIHITYSELKKRFND